MAWIELHQSLVNHRKTLVAADILEIPSVYLLGHLVAFWLWALDNVPDGDLTNITERTIARVTDWTGKPEAFVGALIQAGFLDRDDDSFTIHDWHDYVGRLIGLREHHARRQSLHRDPVLKSEIRDRDQNLCRYCGGEVDWKDRKGVKGGTYDHVTPHGPNSKDNVVVACRSCNSRKQQRTPDEAKMPLLPIGSRLSTPDLLPNLLQGVDKSALHNQTQPNTTGPNQTKDVLPANAGATHAVKPTPWAPPDFFQPLTKLKGYSQRNHSKAAEAFHEQCREAGVEPADAIANFAEFYTLNRTKYGWSDPVAACRRNLGKSIARLLGRNSAPARDPPLTFHQKRIQAEKRIPLRKVQQI